MIAVRRSHMWADGLRTSVVITGVAGIAIAAGWTTARGPMGEAAVGLTASVLLATTLAPSLSRVAHYRLGVALCWIGLLAPVAYSPVNTAQNIATGGVPTHALVEAGISMGAFVALMTGWVPRQLVVTRREWAVSLFVLVAVASASWSAYPSSTILKALQLAGAYALLFILVRVAGRSGVIRQVATIAHLICLSAVVGFAVDPAAAFQKQPYSSVDRLQGVFPTVSTDILGTIAAVGVLALIARVGPRWSLRAGPRVGLLLTDGAVLALARSRAAFAVVVVGMLIALLLAPRTRRIVLLITPVAALSLVLTYAFLAPSVSSYVRRGQSHDQVSSLTGRTHIWALAEGAWKARPAEGYGYYTGHRLGGFASQFSRDISNIDNAWLETLLDLGLLGFVPLFAFALGGLCAAWSPATRATAEGPAVAAISLALLGASTVNPSIQTVSYTMILLGALLLLPGPVESAATVDG